MIGREAMEKGQRRRWFIVQLVPRFFGAVVGAVAFYFIFDLSLLEAALYGLAFATISALASLFWWWLGEWRRSQTPPPPV